MRFLILNAGSSNLKWSILEPTCISLEREGTLEWNGNVETQAESLKTLIPQLGSVDAVGHRIVHGGPCFKNAVLIDTNVRQQLAQLVSIDPTHAQAALICIDAVAKLLPDKPQVAAFDTSFHRTLPDEAAHYAVPWAWTQKFQLKRYGFHGLSVAYAVNRCQELLHELPERLVVCHLGSGCSLTAVKHGLSCDTTMGFTPLEGVMMATRSGTLDPGLLLHLGTQGLDVPELARALNHDAGLLGVSGVSSDLRRVIDAAQSGNARAALAYKMFVRSVTRGLGSMLTALDGLDALIFTGGIGEHQAQVRADVGRSLAFLKLELDVVQNANARGDALIHAPASLVKVLVIQAREDVTIARAMQSLLGS